MSSIKAKTQHNVLNKSYEELACFETSNILYRSIVLENKLQKEQLKADRLLKVAENKAKLFEHEIERMEKEILRNTKREFNSTQYMKTKNANIVVQINS